MRKLLWIVTLFVTALSFSSCEKPYDDTEIWNSVNSLEQRMTAMETVVNAYEKKLFIESVTQIENGYTISFSDGSKATIINGKDGINGTDGKDGDTYIEGITIGENEVTFKLTDGKQFSIPLYSSLSIKFDTESIVMASNSTREVQYTVESILNDISIEVISSADIKAKAIVNKDNCMTGRIEIKFGATIDEYSKLVVLVSNGEKVIMKTLKFEQEEIKVFDETNIYVSEKGGEVKLLYLSNVECEVIIPDSVDWISIAPATKALEQRSIKLLLEPNTEYYRSAVVTLQSPNGDLSLEYTIEQDGNLGVYIDPTKIPDNEIWYTTKDNSLFSDWRYYKTVCGEPFDTKIISHTYANEMGKIIFDKPLTRINDNAFSSYGNYTLHPKILTSIYLPNKIEYIGSGAFGNQKNIETFKVPDSKFELRSSAFQGAKVMKFIGKNILPNGEGILVDGVLYALNYDDKAEQLIIPEGVVEIGESLTSSGNFHDFCNRPNIKKLVVTEGVRKINDCAFWYCTSLESVSLPSTLEEVGSYIFRFCPNIREFIGDSKFITADNKCFLDIFDECGRWGLRLQSAVKVGLPNDYIIPEGLGSISPHSFEGIENLHSITLPNSIMMIESSGSIFRDCPNFEFIYGAYASDDNKCAIVHNELWCDGNTLMAFAGKGIKEYTTYDVKRLGDHLFAYQNQLEKIVINDEVSEIGNYCFSYCPNLKSITLPAYLEVFRYDPFIGSNKLETIYFRSPLPPKFEIGGIEQSQYPFLTIYVPEQHLQAYLNDTSWSPLHKYMKGYQCDDLYYTSSDYSKDGVVSTLQTASKGDGIDIVLMGDAYSDRQIADGSYKADMENLYNNLFTEEPYKSFKDHFNVHYVSIVSATEGYEYSGATLGGFFGNGTYVGGNDNAVFNYALKAISEEEMDDALLVVAMNSDNYAGTCYMYYPENATTTYGSGVSVSYFPRGGDAETFAQLLHHEACGHGFAKLADEYAYEDMGEVPSNYVSEIQTQQNDWGWWKNVDFTSDASQVRWKHFLNDSRYQYEGLGAFEGGLTYWSGVWRPTENSIMHYNTGGFNAPSREAIYYRIHKLAYGDEWEYDYEEFVEWDAKNRKTEASATRAPYRIEKPKEFKPTAPPVVINKNWRDVK